MGQPREDHPVHLDVAGHEQAAARGRFLAVRQPVRRTDSGGALTDFIPVQEQSTLGGVPIGNFTYRGWSSAGSNEQAHNVWRASATYVTGAHSLKIGYQAAFQVQKNFQNAGSQLSYVFNNRTPIQFTLRDAPFWQSNRTRFDAFYVQDQWTRGRLTLQGGLRYEHAWSWFPEGENGVVEDNGSARSSCFRNRRESPGITTSRREWAWRRPVRQRQDIAQGKHQQVSAGGQQRRAVHRSRIRP